MAPEGQRWQILWPRAPHPTDIFVEILIFKDLKINDHTIATQLLLVLKKEYNSWKDYDGDDDDDSINDQD